MTYLTVNFILLLFSPLYFRIHFNAYLYVLGFTASIFNTAGLTLVNKAIANGPMGPVTAIVAVSSILLVLIEAIRGGKWMSAAEILALIIGFFGAMELILP